MKKCPHCGKDISEFVTECPNCHNNVKEIQKESIVIERNLINKKSIRRLGKLGYIPLILALFTVLMHIFHLVSLEIGGIQVLTIINMILVLLLSSIILLMAQYIQNNMSKMLIIIALTYSVLITLAYLFQEQLSDIILDLEGIWELRDYLYRFLNVVYTAPLLGGRIFSSRAWRLWSFDILTSIGFFATHISVIILSIKSLRGKKIE